MANTAFAQSYIITGGVIAKYTATKGGATVGTAAQPIQDVIDAIKADANGADCSIQFGSGGDDELNLGETNITFDGSGTPGWGKITLSGKITAANASYIIILNNNVSVESSADIRKNSSFGISNSGTGTLIITGGTISVNQQRAVNNEVTGTLTITGGTISATDYTVYNNSTGTVNITGGAISGTASNAYTVYNRSTGTINISGGTISTTGETSSRAIYNSGAGIINISGGTISATEGYAVYCNGISGTVVLSGAPNITQRIRMAAVEKLSVANGFSPTAEQIYNIEYYSYTRQAIAVVGGAAFVNNFRINHEILGLAVKDNDLIFEVANGYLVTPSGKSYTITNGSGAAAYMTIQELINTIRLDAGGANCSIQFGNGTDELDIGTEYIDFNGSSSGWGKITLSGKITSAAKSSSSGSGAIYMRNGVSIESSANIRKTTNYGIYNNGTGTLTITGGTITAANYAVYNNSTGTVNISGGEISAATPDAYYNAYIVYNASTGTINISGGEISSTTPYIAYIVYNNSTGTVNISGGEISGTASYFTYIVYNNSTGTVNISGGEISSTDPEASSTDPETYTVYNRSTGTINISDGTISTTGGTSSRAIFNPGAGIINISGGTVSATEGYAVSCNSSGTMVLSGAPIITSIRMAAAEKLSVDDGFSPAAEQVYTIVHPSYTKNAIAVVGGKDFIDNFRMVINNDTYGLAVSGNNLVVTEKIADGVSSSSSRPSSSSNAVSSSSNNPSSSSNAVSSSSGNPSSSSSNAVSSSSSAEIALSSSSGETEISSSSSDNDNSSSSGTTPIRLPQVAKSNSALQTKNGMDLQAKSGAVVEVYGLNGNLISWQSFGGGVYSVSLSHLPKGLYIVKVSFGATKRAC